MKYIFFCFFAVSTLCAPIWGQGNGPTQPEVTNFTPMGQGDWVNPATGDFSYSIPLFDIGGYPVTLGYSAGRTMDEQASCVGLGWSLNTGVVTRNMRGLPDDFSGDLVTKRFNIKDNETWGGNLGAGLELLGIRLSRANIGLNLSGTLGAYYNTYKGTGMKYGLNASLSISAASKQEGGTKTTWCPHDTSSAPNSIRNLSPRSLFLPSASLGINTSYDTQEGITLSPSLSLSCFASIRGSMDISSREGTRGFNLGASVYRTKVASWRKNLLTNSFTPGFDLPLVNKGGTFTLEAGGTAFGVAGHGSLEGYYSGQSLLYKEESASAFGVMYLENANENSLTDFNRESEGALDPNRPSLPMPVMTTDMFGVAGHGFAGSFSLRRWDVGLLSNKRVNNASGSFDFAANADWGWIFNGGMSFHNTEVKSGSGAWSDACPSLKFGKAGTGLDGRLLETAYFKYEGEMSVDDNDSLFHNRGGFDAVALELNGQATSGKLFRHRINGTRESMVMVNALRRTLREKRSNTVYYLTAKEASEAGLERDIKSYQLNSFMGPGAVPAVIPRVTDGRKAHHISEINAIKDGGTRYVFGLPAYNWVQKEKNFAVGATCDNGLASYDDREDGVNNTSGLDNYYNETELPAFAHSFFLTAVLSEDYQDLTNNGPSPDDYGQYTKFNYTKVYDRYRWRTPYDAQKADFLEGHKSYRHDNKATYTYGEKEYWYVHSMESKTQRAEFYYENRSDLHGVLGEDGGLDTSQPLKRLVRIEIYSLPDRLRNGNNAVALQTYNMEYNYSLFQGVPDNKNTTAGTTGKLTLTKLKNTFQKSKKAGLSAYTFEYKPAPAYNRNGNDHWGNLKGYTDPCGNGNKDFPYTLQDKTLQDSLAGAGNLRKINLPSGGFIEVDYESDDYAYVQDKKAMSLFKVEWFRERNGNDLYDPLHVEARPNFPFLPVTLPRENNRVFFRLKQPIPSGPSAMTTFAANYLGDLAIGAGRKFIYTKTAVHINRDLSNRGISENIPMYTLLENYGLEAANASGVHEYGWVDLPLESIRGTSPSFDMTYGINPITKAALRHTINELPNLAYGTTNASSSGVEQIVGFVANLPNTLGQFFNGPMEQMKKDNMCRYADLNKSFIKLYVPDGKKLGGGHRVKRIKMINAFGSMTNNTMPTDTFGTEYSYTTLNAEKQEISSGVVEYEPLTGGEENPNRQPDLWGSGNVSVKDNTQMLEKPYGEKLIPGGGVVYSRVLSKSLNKAGVVKHRAGYQVQEFYTAKDFPIRIDKTDFTRDHYLPNPSVSFTNSTQIDMLTGSQGFCVISNDMHSKPKSQTSYANNGGIVSQTVYEYQTEQGNTSRLDNKVKVIYPNGEVREAMMGIDQQLWIESRESSTSTDMRGANLNVSVFMTPPLPWTWVIPMGLPDDSYSLSRLRTLVATKVIRQHGILKRTIVTENGGTLHTDNLAYDAETGQVMVTNTINEFKKPVYTYSVPAHWAYEGMEGVYQNVGNRSAFAYFNTDADGVAVFTTSHPFWSATNIYPGDVLKARYTKNHNGIATTKQGLLWVKKVNGNLVELIDSTGATLSPNSSYGLLGLMVVKSGRANKPSAPLQQFSSLKSPLVNGWFVVDTSTQILNTQATEYGKYWQRECVSCMTGTAAHPFLSNHLGQWKPVVSWAYANARKQNSVDVVPNLRTGGTFAAYDTFWVYNSSVKKWEGLSTRRNAGRVPEGGVLDNWVRTNHLTIVHPDGTALEARDALDQYKSSQMGYLNSVTTAAAQNARYSEIGFDGFEDYRYEQLTHGALMGRNANCRRHLNGVVNLLTNQGTIMSPNYNIGHYLDSLESHTGKYSLRVFSRVTSTHQRNELVYSFLISPIDTVMATLIADPTPEIGVKRNLGCLPENILYRQKKYWLSVWVKHQSPSSLFDTTYAGTGGHIVFLGTNNQRTTFKPSGPIIDGWQKIEGEFNANDFGGGLKIIFKNPASEGDVWYDDFRVHPYDASFKSYVYDPETLRLTEELDENNFYTRFEYDQQGRRERLKKETERGMMMIQESRMGGRKN